MGQQASQLRKKYLATGVVTEQDLDVAVSARKP